MDINMNNYKSDLRSSMKKRRQAVSPDESRQASLLINKALNQLAPVQKAQTIMAFSSIQNEVDLSLFVEEQHRLGKTILLPRVEGDDLVAVEWKSWQETAESTFGIAEPLGEPFSPQEIDVVLVPGLAFDGHGYRIGYGRGYYDRFLPLLRNGTFKCGVGYEFQVVDNVFPHEKDIPLHWIVTEQSELVIDWDFF